MHAKYVDRVSSSFVVEFSKLMDKGEPVKECREAVVVTLHSGGEVDYRRSWCRGRVRRERNVLRGMPRCRSGSRLGFGEGGRWRWDGGQWLRTLRRVRSPQAA